MSNDFLADFALGDGFRGARWLCDVLRDEPESIREVAARYRHVWRATEWQLEPPKGSITEMYGPGGFSVSVSASAVQLYHMMPFARFAALEDGRTFLRRACFTIANLVGSPRAIYTHELLPDGFRDGLDLDQIEAKLRSTFSAPSSTFAELAAADEFGAGCWYIDDFADLRAASGRKA